MNKSAVYTSMTLLAAILVAGPMLKSQAPPPPAGLQWEYASVTSGRTLGEQTTPGAPLQYFATAYTCFGTPQGCGPAVVSTVQAPNLQTDVGIAMMKAASTLGGDGWELVSVTSVENGNRVMYFRRHKTAQK